MIEEILRDRMDAVILFHDIEHYGNRHRIPDTRLPLNTAPGNFELIQFAELLIYSEK